MGTDVDAMRAFVGEGIPQQLPIHPGISMDVDHAPKRRQILGLDEKKLAIKTHSDTFLQIYTRNWRGIR